MTCIYDLVSVIDNNVFEIFLQFTFKYLMNFIFSIEFYFIIIIIYFWLAQSVFFPATVVPIVNLLLKKKMKCRWRHRHGSSLCSLIWSDLLGVFHVGFYGNNTPTIFRMSRTIYNSKQPWAFKYESCSFKNRYVLSFLFSNVPSTIIIRKSRKQLSS